MIVEYWLIKTISLILSFLVPFSINNKQSSVHKILLAQLTENTIAWHKIQADEEQSITEERGLWRAKQNNINNDNLSQFT